MLKYLPEHKDLVPYSTYIQDQEDTECILYYVLVFCLLFLANKLLESRDHILCFLSIPHRTYLGQGCPEERVQYMEVFI